jgi:hypothetical protein
MLIKKAKQPTLNKSTCLYLPLASSVGANVGVFFAHLESDSIFRKPIAKQPDNKELFIKLVCIRKPAKKTPLSEAVRNCKARVLFRALCFMQKTI